MDCVNQRKFLEGCRFRKGPLDEWEVDPVKKGMRVKGGERRAEARLSVTLVGEVDLFQMVL